MAAISFKRFCFLRFHCDLLLWRNYNATLKRFKIYDSAAVDSNDDEDEMDYLSGSSGADW